MSRNLQAAAGLAIASLAGALLAIAPVFANPYIPASDSEVLERLPEKNDPSLRDLKRLRIAASKHPDDLVLAIRLGRRSIEAARDSGDPRFLGQAQAALAPWWKMPDPPAAALLLRATIKQSNHDFDGAIADLDRLIGRNPADGQALLTRATLLTVQGNYRAARTDCARIAPLTVPLVYVACDAAPASLSGDADSAYRSLLEMLSGASDTDAALREWALTLAGEIAERRGDHAAAETHFRGALALDSRDPYLIAAYCDFLLDRGRAREVPPLVEDQTRNDNLLLRLALAEQQLPDAASAFARHRQDLAERFDAARRRGDSLHRREEARYRLTIEGDARGSLRLARENWQLQREPADLRILAEAASAAGDAATLREVAEWAAANRLQYAALRPVAGERR
ncbi:MAG TPA: tetratricopeptide repeat protein [Casimicrobiaceae bacterium]|nr:tetratricopeptide repeat protein [Casimicrobiaceae bacterium]